MRVEIEAQQAYPQGYSRDGRSRGGVGVGSGTAGAEGERRQRREQVGGLGPGDGEPPRPGHWQQRGAEGQQRTPIRGREAGREKWAE